MQPIVKLVIAGAAMFATLGLIAGLSGMYSLNIRDKTVGTGSMAPPGGPPREKLRKPTSTPPLSQSCGGKGSTCPPNRASWWDA